MVLGTPVVRRGTQTCPHARDSSEDSAGAAGAVPPQSVLSRSRVQ